ncbi:DNA gyrase subunit A [Spiroplasma sp. TIUS-1]|uniref:DNA gyrase subunit A n=1 Tax=Spiroplasma sp. TIUS-1 TaxID=216963 RepID=UPI001397BC2A|nr:DNA gyrase subunit A [Spiroplasma sp. TIUS-1]QHX35559.1 DNA gyrase subunit A [Spiroplasma sp. TIUS-1]
MKRIDENKFIDNTTIIETDIKDEVEKGFLEYAMSVIVSRALPDLRDGLKPVHRRIIYAMNDLKITADSQHKKSARIVGEVIGKYHPHGDTSVYDAMVRMAQDFSYRYPLVDGHGNFGSIDGDGAAAMRYTEARLTKISSMLLKDIDMNTVEFQENYDATEIEPKYLTSYFPNILVNGATGIAVGMATNIPPHNLREVNAAIIEFIRNNNVTIQDLLKHIKGPDFPTGALMTSGSRTETAYLTGHGSITVRAKIDVETGDKEKDRIVVTEIPYQTNKAKLIERIVELYRDKQIVGITDIRDESNYKGMRIVLELAKHTNTQIIITKLFKFTNLQSNFSINMLALNNGIPVVLNLKQIINFYVRHQIKMIVKRSIFEQEKLAARSHILTAISTALEDIDEIVEIIKKSKTNEEVFSKFESKYGFDAKQSKAIVDMRLGRLVGLERVKIEEEIKAIKSRLDELVKLIASQDLQNETLIKQLQDISDKYGDDRRTKIIDESIIEIADEELIADSQIMITLSKNNYIRRLSLDDFKSQKRGGKGVIINASAEDHIVMSRVGRMKDEILFFTDKGRVFREKAYNITQFTRTSRGLPVVNFIETQKGEKVTSIIPIKTQTTKFEYLFMLTENGIAKRVKTSDFARINRVGKIAITLDEGDKLISVVPVTGKDNVLIGSKNGRIVKVGQESFRSLSRKSRGVKAINLVEDDIVIGACSDYKNKFILTISERGIMKKTLISEYSKIGRGSKGVAGMKINDKTGLFSTMIPVRETDELIMISNIGKIVKIGLDEINVQSRNTSGVKGIGLDTDEVITSTCIVWNKPIKDGIQESLIEDIVVDDTIEIAEIDGLEMDEIDITDLDNELET